METMSPCVYVLFFMEVPMKYATITMPDKTSKRLYFDSELNAYYCKDAVIVGRLLYLDGNLYVIHKGKSYFIVVDGGYASIYFNESEDKKETPAKQQQEKPSTNQTANQEAAEKKPSKPWKK